MAKKKIVHPGEWFVQEGRPVLEIESRALDMPFFVLRIPNASAFRLFHLSLLDAGCEAFPEIAREHELDPVDPERKRS